MTALLRCPSCNEIITANSTECKYCSLTLDRSTVEAEIEKFEDVSKAVSQANTIQSFNSGLIIVALLCVYLLISGASGAQRAYVHVLPVGGFIWVISWFVRFRNLRSKDPDFEPARAGMNRSLMMWSIGVVVYIFCLVWAIMGGPFLKIQ
jgi:hypothetical protein